MDESNKKNPEFEKDSEAIMEETLKGIFDEVNKTDEDKEEKETPDAPGSGVSGSDVGAETAGGEDHADEEAARTEGVEVELDAADAEDVEPELDAADAEDVEPELDMDDSEEFEEEDEPMSEEEKARRRKKRKKVLGIVFGSVFGVIAAAYLGLSVFFMSHFYFNTSINGVSFSAKSVKDVESYMEQQVKDYELDLNESDGGIEIIKGSDIDLAYKKSDGLNKLLKEQNAFLWPKSLWEKPEIAASVGVEYSEAKLTTVMEGLSCMLPENQTEPEMAKPEFDGNVFAVKPEVTGSKIDTETFQKKAKEYIEGFRNNMDMTQEDCYIKPKYVSDSQEVLDACTAMNKYMASSITYTFGSATEVVDKALISQWLTTDENMAVAFNTDAVSQYIQDLASKYNTYQRQRSFTSGGGNAVTVEGGDYGWVIDKNAEYEALVANIQNGEVLTKEPVYSQTAATHDGVDWGSTYVEVDLSNQYMWVFVNGSVVTSGPIVTGKPSAGDATPQGVYYIKYCQKNATLRGPKKPDGTYEWESPVTFWMPFNGGIGLHDAPWQAAYGGSRYLTHGSHGCVNLQYDVAQTTFNNVQAGTPVVCHY